MITGTFLDEITHDIPSQNWGPREWAQDFMHMKEIGIDTVILIRAGYKNQAVFDSKVLKQEMGLMPAKLDLLDLFLEEAEKNEMSFYFGLYDSGHYWASGHFEKESNLNKVFCEEVLNKYGHRKAWKGWYLSHEIHAYDDGMMQLYRNLAEHLKKQKNMPTLISPYVKGAKQFGSEAVKFDQHIHDWRKVFQSLKGFIDIVAFQDGQVNFAELPSYLKAHKELADEFGLASWSNVESFDRDMPIKFPPTDIRKLQYKIEEAQKVGAEKIITFEFSHFMSPQSCYPAARNLNQRYKEWIHGRL